MENQILDENVSQSTEVSFDDRVKNILDNGYNFDLGKYLSTGAQILNKNAGGFIGFLFVWGIIQIGVGLIPLLGSIANWLIISPCMMAGMYLMAHRVFKGRNTDFGKFFSGFQYSGPLALLTFIMTLMFAAIVIPYIFIVLGSMVFTIIDTLREFQSGNEDPMLILQFILDLMMKFIFLFIIIWLVGIFFSFAQYIVVFGKKNFWDAMVLSVKIVSKKYFYFLMFSILLALINVAGALVILIGLLYTVPLSICAMYAAYEHIVGTNLSDVAE